MNRRRKLVAGNPPTYVLRLSERQHVFRVALMDEGHGIRCSHVAGTDEGFGVWARTRSLKGTGFTGCEKAKFFEGDGLQAVRK